MARSRRLRLVRKGKRGRGAAGKVCVFGILKRGGKVHALPVADASSRTLADSAENTGFSGFSR
jgi:transposase